MIERSLALDFGMVYQDIDAVFNTTLASDAWAGGIPGLAEDQVTKSFISRNFFALYTFYVAIDEMVDFEEYPRLSNGQCTLEKIQEADLKELMDMEDQLNSRYESLPTAQDRIQPNKFSDLVENLRITLLMRCLSFVFASTGTLDSRCCSFHKMPL
ncbi:hypothetical protein N7520_000528 [Penicillium odoratum]|uniref:uncharacterized protein n=1 Tax=Penicillium odoratum TaxID=1167516 RepID=UPI00254684DA|nr:uncharacterized protein N7520_000528 [Penicillium odoratum]KAJ5777282.1 hypothetical protein N7520_000528 [Penicillium odoratum]